MTYVKPPYCKLRILSPNIRFFSTPYAYAHASSCSPVQKQSPHNIAHPQELDHTEGGFSPISRPPHDTKEMEGGRRSVADHNFLFDWIEKAAGCCGQRAAFSRSLICIRRFSFTVAAVGRNRASGLGHKRIFIYRVEELAQGPAKRAWGFFSSLLSRGGFLSCFCLFFFGMLELPLQHIYHIRRYVLDLFPCPSALCMGGSPQWISASMSFSFSLLFFFFSFCFWVLIIIMTSLHIHACIYTMIYHKMGRG